MKKNKLNNNFKHLIHSGISLIVLVITIIVIIILAAAIIISLNNNNPIMEANTARYESDTENMQAIFTNAVAKVMGKNQATVSVSPGQINTITGGQKEVDGQVAYTLTDAQNASNATGTIVFDKGDNTDTKFYTGKKLPIYAAGDTKWYVDSEGNISLEVAGTKYGNGEVIKITEETLIDGVTFKDKIPSNATEVIFTDETISDRYIKGSSVSTTEYIDVSVEQNESIVAWMEGTVMKVSSQENNTKIKANNDTSLMFYNKSNLTKIDVKYLDTFDSTDMSSMFSGCSNLVSLDLANFNTYRVTNMHSMFNGCSKITSLDLSSFDTSNVSNMQAMFYDCSSLESIDLSNFNTLNTTVMHTMFFKCKNIKSLDLSNFNTSNVTTMYRMFYGCLNLSSLNLTNFITLKVTNMSEMFKYCYELTSLDLTSFNMSSTKNTNGMFEDASKLTNLKISNTTWSITAPTNYTSMFKGSAIPISLRPSWYTN